MIDEIQEKERIENDLRVPDRVVNGTEIVGRVLVHLSSIAFAFLGMLGLIASLVWVSGWYYDTTHITPGLAGRGGDLGAGLFVVLVLLISFLVSLPIGFYLYRRASRAILKRTYGD